MRGEFPVTKNYLRGLHVLLLRFIFFLSLGLSTEVSVYITLSGNEREDLKKSSSFREGGFPVSEICLRGLHVVLLRIIFPLLLT